MYFLSGMMAVMPKGIPAEQEAQRLLLEGFELMQSSNWNAARLGHIARNGQKFVKVMNQICNHTRQLDEDLTSALTKKKK
jgi:hypothetical protein